MPQNNLHSKLTLVTEIIMAYLKYTEYYIFIYFYFFYSCIRYTVIIAANNSVVDITVPSRFLRGLELRKSLLVQFYLAVAIIKLTIVYHNNNRRNTPTRPCQSIHSFPRVEQ